MTTPRTTRAHRGDGAEPRPAAPWRLPTRRAFVAALAAAAAALAIDDRGGPRALGRECDDDRPPSRWSGTTRWIGHC